MAIFNFIATKTYYICNVYGNTITISNTVSTPIDVSLLSSSELRMLALGVLFQDLNTNDNVSFEAYYTGILGDITSSGSSGTSKEQIQDTVAEMLENGTLITSDYDDNDGTIQLTPLPGILIKDYVNDTSGAVHINGGEITLVGGVSFSLSPGDGYVKNTANEIAKIEWPIINASCQFNGNNFIGIDYNGDVVVSSSQLGPEIIPLGYINTAAGNTLVTGFSNIHANSQNGNYWINQWVRNAVGANVEYGCNVSALPSPNELSINMSSGRAWAQFNEIDIDDITTFTKLYGSSLGFLINASNPNIIDNVNINDRSQAPGSALVPMTTGFFKKDLVFVTAEGNLYYLTATSEWPTLEEAQKAPMPEAPSSIKAQIIMLAGIVVQKNASIISDIIDVRPMFSKLFETGTSAIPSTAISHNDLTDLNVDSHIQYHNDIRGDIRYYRKTEVDAYLANKADVSHSHSNATSTVSGFMSSSDKAKLDTFVLSSVLDRSNHTGTQDASTITGLSKSSVGLNNVDNTSDLNKPISTATQTALNLKIDTVANAGGGAGILKDVTGATLNLKTIVGDGSVEITTGTDLISLSSRHAKHPQNPYITQFDDFAIAQTAFFLQTNAAGSGSGVTQNGQPVFGGADKRFGIKICNTGTTITGYAGLYGINAFFNFGNLTDGDYVEFSTSLRVLLLSDATNRYTIYFGFTDQTTSTEAVDGAYFKYSDNLSGGAIQYVTSNNSTRTATSTGVTLVANTDYTLRVRVSNIGGTISAAFYIDGVEIAAGVTTNLPITSLRTTSVGMYIGKSTGTSNRTMEVDWVYFEYKTSRNITL